MIKYVIVYYNI